jgi:hypothetical protein
MPGPSVVDELVVKLRLDAADYKKTEKEVDAQVSKTEAKAKDVDAKRKRRDEDQKKRWRELGTEAKAFTRSVGAIILTVAGLGAAVVSSLTSLNAFELGLRRQGVSTGLSNRQLQAWGSTARRLGADADAGADAIANLAKEQKQFRLTGEAPTLQALARAGVRVSPDAELPDILASAQQVYRGAAPAQRQQLEATLAAQGVSPDLILMIKSEKDAREAYTRSLAEASTENRQALDAMSDAMASVKASAVSVANSLATVLQPVTEKAAVWLSQAAVKASEFTDKVIAAGGGLDGFITVVDKEAPTLGTALHALADVVDVVRLGFKKIGEVITAITGAGGWADRFNAKVQAEVAKPDHNPLYGVLNSLQNVGKGIAGGAKRLWGDTVENAHEEGFNTFGAGQKPIEWIMPPEASAPGQAPSSDALLLTRKLVENGLTVPQAAAVVANWQQESGLNPGAFNAAGGGTGARGLAQWRGNRTSAFQARFGVTPDRATIDQQIQFMLTDPYEKSLLASAFAGKSDAAALGAAYSRIYEAHGNAAEDALRGQRAAALAAQYRLGASPAPSGAGPGSPEGGGNTITVQSMTVVANNPAELANGIARQSGVQSYNSAVR